MNEKNENNRKGNLSHNLRENLHRRKESSVIHSEIKDDIEDTDGKSDTSTTDNHFSKKPTDKYKFPPRKHFSKNFLVRFFQKIKVFCYKLIGKKHGYFIHSNKMNKSSGYYKKNNKKFYHKPHK